MTGRFYFRQLLAGRDFAVGDPVATQMVNFVYALGDRQTGDAVLVDPAYRPGEIVSLVEADGMRVTGVLATHFHADHVGGDLVGHEIAGIAELLETNDVPIHVQADEVEWILKRTGVGADALVAHQSGDQLAVGGLDITLIHTPGHTPGSQCFSPTAASSAATRSSSKGAGAPICRIGPRGDVRHPEPAPLAGERRHGALPGHFYSASPSAPMGEVRGYNAVLAPSTPEQWLAMFTR